ncbi:MAG: amidohydrolase family protein [Acidimicrobiia bacterium]
MHELVIRGATIVDGTGAERFPGDVAIDGGVVTEVAAHPRGERIADVGYETIDADGLLLTPGFVDIHTHYDGQIRWDPWLTPSCWHGITTSVLGNCGVGFAPAKPAERDLLADLMEYVEAIPGDVLRAGLDWAWESFPEYLDVLDRGQYVMDVAAQIPHSALRVYVMGQRGVDDEPATDDDIAAMAALVRDAMQAGALGFSTSRTLAHIGIDGRPVPGTYATERELFAIGDVLGEVGTGVFEVAPLGSAGEDPTGPLRELEWMVRLAARIRRPVSFVLLQIDSAPGLWREVLAGANQAAARGAQVRPQIAGRPFGLLSGLQTTHPFTTRPSYEKIASLPLAERVAAMRDPAVRAAILSERDPTQPATSRQYEKVFVLGDPPDYEPGPERSIAAIAAAEGRDAEDVYYDRLLEDDGRQFLTVPLLNYSEGSADPLREMIVDPCATVGLGDGGAHLGQICDVSMTTSMLTHWARDRSRGEGLPLELVVRRMTRDTAELYGFGDRGVVAPGARADLNLVDFDRLRLRQPEWVDDLPAGGGRLVQRADGYVATFVGGVAVSRDDEVTGARPGRLVRGTG